MSGSPERILTNTRAESFAEAIDLFVEDNYHPEQHGFRPLNEGSFKVSFTNQVADDLLIKSDLAIGVDYKMGFYRLASTQTEISSADSHRLLESDEFIFFQDQDRIGTIQLLVTNHQDGLPVCANYTLQAIEEYCPNAYEQYRFALLIMLSVIAASCYDRDLFDPYVAKVKRLVSETVETESLDQFWKNAVNLKKVLQVRTKH
ncbi:MAG: hypothetical protein WAV56_01740 [Microgenomates group bacterium]